MSALVERLIAARDMLKSVSPTNEARRIACDVMAEAANALTALEAPRPSDDGGEQKQGFSPARRSEDRIAPTPQEGRAWMPIESAPKYTHVLAWFPKGEHVVALMGGTPDSYESVGYLGIDAPTHWMPLPASPSHACGIQTMPSGVK